MSQWDQTLIRVVDSPKSRRHWVLATLFNTTHNRTLLS